METNMKIPETRGGSNQVYPFDEIAVGKCKLFTDVPDSIRSAVANYAKRHNMKFVTRTERIKGKKIGITIYRIK